MLATQLCDGEVLPLSEKVRVLGGNKNCMLRLLRSIVKTKTCGKNEASVCEVVKKEEEICASFAKLTAKVADTVLS